MILPTDAPAIAVCHDACTLSESLVRARKASADFSTLTRPGPLQNGAKGTKRMTMSRHRRYVRSPLVYEAHGFVGVKPDSGVLPVSCWCERRIVAVRQTDVQTGKTESCGHPKCHAPRSASRLKTSAA